MVNKYVQFFLLFLFPALLFAQNSWNMTYHDSWQASHQGAYYNDCWGYVDSAGREYAILGSNKATHFLDVTDPNNIVHVQSFNGANQHTIWRDFKVWDHYAFGVNDGADGSFQIFDLQYLPDSVVKIYDEDTLGSTTHNIQMWRSDLYMIDNSGSGPGGFYTYPLRVVSVQDPFNPTTVGGIFDQTFGKGHDLYVYHDTVYLSYISGANEGLFIYDFRAPAYPNLVGSLTSYPESGANHSSWGNWDNDVLIMCDEFHNSAVKVIDISDKTNPTTITTFKTHPGAMAHNPFVVDTLVFIAYYHDGLQVWSIADPANPYQVGYYDTDTTVGGGSNYPGFLGCWGTYPFFPSGTLIASDITNGLFTVTLNGWNPPPPPPLPVGLEEEKITGRLSVYPNPSKGNMTIDLGSQVDQILQVEVFGVDGKRIINNRVEGHFQRYDFDLSSYQKGLYLVRVHGPNFEKRGRIILE